MEEALTPKRFLNKILAGTATGIIVGLIPNAVLSVILGAFGDNSFAVTWTQATELFQIATPAVIGFLIGLQFNLNPMRMSVVGVAALIGSGSIQFNDEAGAFIGAGTGDIINTMITAAIAVGLILLIGDKFGSVEIIGTPIVVGTGASLIGLYLYPYITAISAAIGTAINTFTTLQPVLMSILISCSFALLIISPISTIAIGLAIQLDGVAAGAAAMGVGATTIVLVVNSWRINKSGITIAIALGAMKMMMPNLFRKPIILVPCFFTAIVAALPVAFLGITGTPASAGFGLVGLVGPFAAIDGGQAPIMALICWIVVPAVAAIVSQYACEKVLNLYKRQEVFEFLG
ncbi:PTS sugar transporter subunit IIC [Tetragenococcus halophilus]|uniref:PTS sugar transporter subunit IIC n=1 Tax=Tetragenococcus halophilus TaxID=51669 RepID=UPI000CBAE6B8|nr:PTS sugar transporter subunit IIC [Tetragenococcus halophilus]MCO8284366.1 PTS sugar transporter subunit IIC [Tetragenococcus halophilus]GBD66879.1 putative uncharacterized protein [Tetragenococcus halophilus subsp. halophilus]GBD77981.1 putative uncharacterized protein [Tetragenococcus halophilus subsp. halophilus]GFK23771.1 membrane protein [Tetragenococcus halophilus]GMG62275.1 PTS sugar transporter subunit IIC [Tetragenococcus halophilus]